jgi:hypothetical protein
MHKHNLHELAEACITVPSGMTLVREDELSSLGIPKLTTT